MAKEAPALETREVLVNVGLDTQGNIQAIPNYFEVSKQKNEEVRWGCAQDHKHDGPEPCFTVDFEKNGSPFYETQFSSNSPVSTPPRPNVLPVPQIYQYT